MEATRRLPKLDRPYRRYVADLLTLSNGAFGFLAILVLSVEFGPFQSLPDRYVAAFWIGLGMVADGVDGIVARRWGSTGLGASLDLMSDAITFALAPAVLMLEVQGPGAPIPTSIGAAAILVCGMLRLARNHERGRERVFDGLPAPWSGATLAIVSLLQVEAGLPVLVPALVAIVLSVLNVTHIPYPRTIGPFLTRLVLGILLVALGLLVAMVLVPSAARPLLIAAAALAALLVAGAPLVAPRREHR